MIACIRKGIIHAEIRNSYLKQINLNQMFIRKYVSFPVGQGKVI